ncbi:biopolymer transporter ExbD [Myxococcus landrumensis]|uniref:Biopolymer transporter ExbD n=1 Tax=Myxococcus landrumensis TaxID=2813577 RepID=A0ABX7MYV8_9BACT|nr:biopolymer transporter ExbD [Myxococcus landrumus]QSQ11398.1 biopolymer transporter ExbD [Myxococcus landrumus]
MGMSMGGGRGGMKSEINVTPLVDVVLVLLIIFMVVTPMMKRGKEVELPQAQQTEEDGPDPLILSMTPDRKLFVESEVSANEADFQSKLRNAMRADPKRRLLLKADQSLTYSDVMKVMLLAKATGAEKVSLAVVTPKQGP